VVRGWLKGNLKDFYKKDSKVFTLKKWSEVEAITVKNSFIDATTYFLGEEQKGSPFLAIFPIIPIHRFLS